MLTAMQCSPIDCTKRFIQTPVIINWRRSLATFIQREKFGVNQEQKNGISLGCLLNKMQIRIIGPIQSEHPDHTTEICG